MKEKYIVDSKITNEFVEAFIKTTYRIIGKNKHSAIKPCHWFEQRLLTGRDNRNCYKGIFGIQSHRCLQNTPSLPFCNHQCVFCWRDIENGSLGSEFAVEPDDPKEIIEEQINRSKQLLKKLSPVFLNTVFVPEDIEKTREKLFEFAKLINVETSNLTNGYPFKLMKKKGLIKC